MKPRTIALAFLPLLLAGGAAQDPAAQDLIEWAGSYDEARHLARESGRPLMVVFR